VLLGMWSGAVLVLGVQGYVSGSGIHHLGSILREAVDGDPSIEIALLTVFL